MFRWKAAGKGKLTDIAGLINNHVLSVVSFVVITAIDWYYEN